MSNVIVARIANNDITPNIMELLANEVKEIVEMEDDVCFLYTNHSVLSTGVKNVIAESRDLDNTGINGLSPSLLKYVHKSLIMGI